MPNKLKDLKITKVDFVDQGANPGANIMLFKRREPAEAANETTPPPAAQAGTESPSALKRFFGRIAKALSLDTEDFDAVVEEVEKDAATFDEIRQRREAADEIWEYCYTFHDSLCSIFWDNDTTPEDKEKAMQTSTSQFLEAVNAAIVKWAKGQPIKVAKTAATANIPTAEQIETAKRIIKRLEGYIQTANPAPPEETPGENTPQSIQKGAQTDMKIDKSKLTPEELSTLEAIEKKAGIEEEPVPPAAAAEPAANDTPAAPPAAEDDIYKGLHPAVKAEIERLRKSVDAAEERELEDIAKKYEIIGKKPEELVPTFKALKAAGGNAYDQMIAVLDASVEAVEKSGIFSEIGKRGNGSTAGDAWATIEKHAEGIQKSAPNMTWAEAVDTACQQHPELVHDYENGR